MKKGQIYEGIVKEVIFPDKAVVVTNLEDENGILKEHRVIVKGALPGQTVKYMIKKARSEKCQGRLLSVIKKSPEETEESVCKCFGICGGCNYQTLPYEAQLELKKNQVLKLINSVVKEGSYIFDGILPSPCIWGYRNKMEFSFGDEYKGGPLALGLHKKGSIHDIVNSSGCKIIHNDYSIILNCVREYFQKIGIAHYNKNTHTGVLRHLLIRRAASTGEILVALVTTSALETELKKLTRLIEPTKQTDLEESTDSTGLNELSLKLKNLELEGSLTGFLHIINDGLGDVVKSDETRIIYGKDWITENILGLKFRISVFSFFQTNTKGAEVLYKRARDYVLRSDIAENDKLENCNNFQDKVVFDLYSGTGTIAQIIAPVVKKVMGVEIVEEAVEAAKRNAEYNGLSNCEFIAGDVLKVIDEIKEKPDFIILDPPREGVHPKALKKICAHTRVHKMIYVSCNPTTLIRDLTEIQEYGYKVKRICCIDMFPHCSHVETVCLLSKLHADHHIEVELQMDELDLTAAESKATYEEIKDYVLEHTGLKVSSLYIAQVKEKCGIIERVNYNQPKSENSRQPKCPPEKEAAIRDALEHFRMI